MEENFNPYLKWLGIPLEDQPPNHYQLLGIPAFMDDADVISNSADRQMGHVRNFASGKYSQLSQKLLNEIAAAKVCLLNPAKKEAYDQHLRSLTSAASAPAAAQARPLPQAQPVLHTRLQPQGSPLPGNSSVPILEPAAGSSVSQRLKKKSSVGMILAGVIGLVLVGGAAMWMLNRPAQEASREESSPHSAAVAVADRSDEDTQAKDSATDKENGTSANEQTSQDPMAVSEQDTQPSAATPENSDVAAEEVAGGSTDTSQTHTTSDTNTPQSAINLLEQIDISRDRVQGNWKLDGQDLISPLSEELNRFMFPGKVPPEYVLDMEVERVAGDNVLFVGLMVGGKQVELFFDYQERGKPAHSSFAPKEKFPQHQGPLLQPGQSSRIRCQVTDKRVVVSVDGETIFDLTDRLDELEMPQHWAIPNKQVLFVGSYLASFRFTKLELTPLESSNPNSIAQSDDPPAQEKTSPSVNLLEQIDLKRDSAWGDWTLEENALISPQAVEHAKFMLPGEVPLEYLLEMEVERVAGDNMLLVALVIDGKQRGFYIDWHPGGQNFTSGFSPIEIFPPHRGAIFKKGEPRYLQFHVTAERVVVKLDGDIMFDLRERIAETSNTHYWDVPNKEALVLGSNHSSYRFTKLELTPLDENASLPNQETSNNRPPLAEKLPLPTGPELEKAQQTLSEVFKEDLAAAKSTEQKRAIAQTLLKHATDDTQKPVEKFVLLKAARTVAIGGADPATAMKAIDLLDETFVIQPLELKADTLTNLSKSVGTTEEEIALITEIGEVVRQMVEAEQFDAAKPLTRLAQNVAIQMRNADLRRKLAASVEEFDELHEAFRKIQIDLQKLQDAPDDPKANLAVGRYRAFSQLNWEDGLKHLAAGSDKTLSELAKKDLTGTEDSADQLKLADAWWEEAEAETRDLQAGPKIRAGYWYRRAMPSLTGLTREKILKRLDEIRELDPEGQINPKDWETWVFDNAHFIDTQNAKIALEDGEMSLTNNLNNVLLLVYQPFISIGPCLATFEIKGEFHAIGLIQRERLNHSIKANGPRDNLWHTVTLERLADKSLVVMIDGNKVGVRLEQTDNNLSGKIAFWLLPRQTCSIRRFEIQTSESSR